MRQPQFKHRALGRFFVLFVAILLISGCGMGSSVDELVQDKTTRQEEVNTEEPTEQDLSKYYGKFYEKLVAKRGRVKKGTTEVVALDALPKDSSGRVDWTAAVLEGYIDPRASLDPGYEEEPPLDLNIFIEAKTPLIANVIFPHSIHTYWLKCSTCHPNIFLPEAGANPITMNEIFEGKWCGRCHGKVAFTFWPRSNCTRCHIIPKGESKQQEHFR